MKKAEYIKSRFKFGLALDVTVEAALILFCSAIKRFNLIVCLSKPIAIWPSLSLVTHLMVRTVKKLFELIIDPFAGAEGLLKVKL